MAAPKKKKQDEQISLIEQFNAIDEQKTYEMDLIESGQENSIYRVQPVDILTFVSHPDYMGPAQYDPPLSEHQLKFMESVTDFENEKTMYVLWV